MKDYVAALLHLYNESKALYDQDDVYEGFEWINADDGDRSIFSFLRHSKHAKENLLFVINFTPMDRPDYRVGVWEKKKYTLVLNSDEAKYGGYDVPQPKTFEAEEGECDGKPYSFGFHLPPYGAMVFRF